MKFKRILSAALSAVMAASCLSVGAWAETNDKAENIEEAATSDSALSLTETVSAELADETEYSFGSSGVAYAPGTYDIGVSLKNASNTANDSMAASRIVGGQLIVSDDGTARVKIELTSVTVGTITGWASDWVIYQGTSASGDTVAADGTENSDGNISEIEFDLPDNSYDGVYVNMYIAVMDMSTNAYLAFDYANDSSDDTDDGETTETTYTGTAAVAVFGYDVTVTVTVADDVITAVSVEGEAGNTTSQSKLESAAEGLSE